MRLSIICVLLTFHLHSFAQENRSIRYSGNFENEPFQNVLSSLESETGFKFYYNPVWMDSLVFTGSFDQTPMNDVLGKLVEQTDLHVYVQNSKVILTYKSPIITGLGITQFFDVNQPSEPAEKGLVFTREYLGSTDTDNPEAKVYEIGKIGQLKRGESVTIAGYVKDVETGEPVEGALVYIQKPLIGTSTDPEGFYSLTIPNGKQQILVNSLNMKNTFRKTVLFSSGTLNIDLEVDVIALKAVVVNADRDINIKDSEMGVTRIDVADAKNVPVLLGERDLVKIATTTSGVQSVGEGASGINIRGAKADQNLFLMDGAPVYNTSHFFGFFSVFNSDAIGSFDLYKSFIPAKHGGRLSSVFEIKTKVPNKEKFTGSGGIGPVTSRLLAEIPIIKDKTSLMIGGRGTYSNFVLDRVKGSSLGNIGASFYDVVAKVHHTINEKNDISVSAYHSFDSFQLPADSLLSFTNFSYTNTNFSSIWKHTFNDNFDGELNFASSEYNYDIGYDELPTQAFNIGFKVKELTGAVEFDYYFSEQWSTNFGSNFKRYDVVPGHREALGSQSLIAEDRIEDEQGVETSTYLSSQYDVSENLTFIGGIRYSLFSALGPGNSYIYEDGQPRVLETRIDSDQFAKNETIKTYSGSEWRLSGRYSIDDLGSLKMSVIRTRQYIHILNNSASIAPTNIWRLSSEYIRPQIADQFSIGYYRNFNQSQIIETSIELYYKKLQNLLDFKVGADLQFNQTIETDILQGDGKTYGAEFSIRKPNGWFSGWLNYTYSRSFLKLDGNTPDEIVNGGVYFPTSYDKPHYFNIVTNYKFTRRYSMSVNMVYSTGRPITYPVGKWAFNGVENIYYSDRNEFRIPDYFRVDLGLNIEGNHRIKKLAHSFWTFSIYNLLGKDNVYSIFFKTEEGEVSGFQLSVFPQAIPTITYNFTF